MTKRKSEDQKRQERYAQIDGAFCYCGLVAIKKINGAYLCHRHNASPSFRAGGRGRYPGKSATPYGQYEDK